MTNGNIYFYGIYKKIKNIYNNHFGYFVHITKHTSFCHCLYKCRMYGYAKKQNIHRLTDVNQSLHEEGHHVIEPGFTYFMCTN